MALEFLSTALYEETSERWLDPEATRLVPDVFLGGATRPLNLESASALIEDKASP